MAFNRAALWGRLAGAFGHGRPVDWSEAGIFAPAEVMPGTVPSSGKMAFDADLHGSLCKANKFFGELMDGGLITSFAGYPALAMLQQNGLVQAIVGKLTEKMMRKRPELDGPDSEQVQAALDKFNFWEHLLWAVETCGYQGGALLFLDMGVDDPAELAMPLSLDRVKIPLGSFKGFRQVEPFCVAPAEYNASNPLADDYYNPSHWYVQGRKVHKSRFLRFGWNSIPVLLRPAYNFFGIPLPQVCLPYIINFERSRDASSELVFNYSLLGLKTELDNLVQPNSEEEGGESSLEAYKTRIRAMLAERKNNGLAVIDKNSEEFFQVNTPVSGIEGLVAQQLELLALIPGIPVTELFGTPPRGFNATGKSDNDNFASRLESIRSRLVLKPFDQGKAVIELATFGEVRGEVGVTWPTLKEADPLQTAQIQLCEAQRDGIYIGTGSVRNTEVRERLSKDEASGYHGLTMGVKLPPPVTMADPSLSPPPMNVGAETETSPQAAALAQILQKGLGNG